MSKRVALTVIDDGPLKVSGDQLSVRYCGERLAVEGNVFLCRCGQSAKPPFCDGSHSRTGFVAEPALGEKKEIRVWEGKTIRTFFNPNTCMHVFYCKPLKELREQELGGDEAAAKEIARVVRSCPSGALSYESREVPEPTEEAEVDIDIMEGGEVRVQCAFEIDVDVPERQYSDRATLCRCGLSKNKPWCDGRHKKRSDFR